MSTETKTNGTKLEQKKESKKFNITYAIIACVAFAAVALTIISVYYINTFVMFSPEKVAEQYVTNQMNFDGYDALKYTTLSKSGKMGDYLRNNYMAEYKKDDENGEAPKLSAEADGDLLTQILDKMYPTFVSLVETYGFEDYDNMFSKYFAEYAAQHKALYGHDFISEDDMFAAIEGNLATYMSEHAYRCEIAYGKGEDYAKKYLGINRTITPAEEEENPYSAGYAVLTNGVIEKEYSDEEIKTYVSSLSESAKKAYENFGIKTDEISAVAIVKVTPSYSGEGSAELINAANKDLAANPVNVTLVKIGSQWYVDIAA